MERDCIFFDTEDNSQELIESGKSGFEKKVTQIYAIAGDGEEFYSRGDVEKFLHWLQDRQEHYIYAHNLQYDLGALFADNLDELDLLLVGGRLIKAGWGRQEFRDTFNIFPMSAKKLGEQFGIEKLAFDSESKEYVKTDVKIIHAALKKAFETAREYRVDKFPSTLGGLAVKMYRSMGLTHPHDSNTFHRQALYGGRVELFATGGKGEVWYTDINSLYPFCMTKEFPDGNVKVQKDVEGFGVADIEIEVPECEIAPLPVRRKDGSIYFPYGKFRGIYTFHEIRNAVEMGAKILRVIESYGTSTGVKYYDYFVNHFYKKRLESKNSSDKLVYKLLMNNLYGRLAIQGDVTRSLKLTEKTKWLQGTVYGKKILTNVKTPVSQEANYMHAAYVTSYGRLELIKYLKKVGAKNLIYCDTDSIFFVGKPPFDMGTELGEMKLEFKAAEVRAFSPKVYKIDDTYKAKGVPIKYAKEFIEEGEATFAQPFKLRESIEYISKETLISAGKSKSMKKKLAVWRMVTKKMSTQYDKKVLVKNNFFPKKHVDSA